MDGGLSLLADIVLRASGCRSEAAGKTHLRLTQGLDRVLQSIPIAEWQLFWIAAGDMMANEEQLKILLQGAEVWNRWRELHPAVAVDLSGANLFQANLDGANLSGADLTGANLFEAELLRADLSKANLTRADLSGVALNVAKLTGANLALANLQGADLQGADLQGADLAGLYMEGADLSGADLSGADLTHADLSGVRLAETILRDAKLCSCRVRGLSAWDVNLEGADQSGLILSPDFQSTITIDNLIVGQFVNLLLNNAEVRDVIDTVSSKIVLIVGWYMPERVKTWNAVRVALLERHYVPITVNIDWTADIRVIETLARLVSLARFVVVDFTDPLTYRMFMLPELYQLLEKHASKPVQPILLKGSPLNTLHSEFQKSLSCLPLHEYSAQNETWEMEAADIVAAAERWIEEHGESLRI